MDTQEFAAKMLADLLDSDEAIGPSVRVRLERALHVLRGRAFTPEPTEDRRSNEIKKRVRDGLKSATADELAAMALGLRVSPAVLRQVMGAT